VQPEPAATVAPSVAPRVPDATAAAAGNNLDLLLEVPLAVTLRFGQRRMPLRDVLQLSSGAVIELDRQAEDAVDLLLDERLIARGQVVVVDGCYGLRVTEVCR
jgi:flagellar motor switch protein FliN/FliY